MIALTFDDGPHVASTLQLLALLKQFDVKATFFVVGEMAEQHPELVRAIAADGHVLGNHTFHHVNLKKIAPEYVAVELKACGEVVQSSIGRAPHLFRPPGGDYTTHVSTIAGRSDIRRCCGPTIREITCGSPRTRCPPAC